MSEEQSAEEFAREESATADDLMEVDLHDDRTRAMSHLDLNRITEWSEEDREAMDGVHGIIDRVVLENFGDAYRIMNDLYEIVREPVVLPGGVIATDAHGFTIWERTESGSFVEDYSKLGSKEIKDFLFKITTRLFEWEQRAAQMWTDAMFAKALWEQALSRGYTGAREAGGRTVEDRTQIARAAARDPRFFALFHASISRRSDSLVRSMTLLSQRMKDVLSA